MVMEDSFVPPSTMLSVHADSGMDCDYMDNLLLEGCWLETFDGSKFFNPGPASSTAFIDSSFLWPTSETGNGDSVSSLSQRNNQEEEHCPVDNQAIVQDMAGAAKWGNCTIEGSEVSRRFWIGPRANPGPRTSVRERLIRALGYIKDFLKDKDVLIQVWVPVNKGGRCVLTTQDQQFALVPNCQRLTTYRDISVNYQFSAEEDAKDHVGLPGRVFLGKVPEWIPDVRFFRSEEYLRVNHAQQYDICGTLALPVFEQGSKNCLGVIEVVTTAQKIEYQPEFVTVCRALKVVDLQSSEVPRLQHVKAYDSSYQIALPEIHKVLRFLCMTHKLPLAQIWVSCAQQRKEGCQHSDENYYRCISTVDRACYIHYSGVQAFHEACSEHHLLKGQGVAGEAFLTNQPCFSSDITSYSKTEYPLSHHARMFGLHAAVAIRLRSVHTGTADFVLEFFLPVDCTDPEKQKNMLTSLSIIMQEVCQSLRVVTNEELEEDTNLPVSELVAPSNGRPSREEILRLAQPSKNCAVDNSSGTARLRVIQQSGSVVSSHHKGNQKDPKNKKSTEHRKSKENYSLEESTECGVNSAAAEGSFSSICMGKTGVKKRTKAEKAITLEILRQHFSGSLKDAAKNIGVCPTTLKRICRQYGIKRWPSRKIKKVGHSLQKLQHVIDSVQGASDAFQIGSFYTNFPELASPKLSRSSLSSTSKQSDHPEAEPSTILSEGGVFSFELAAPKSPSSCCQSSTSSQSCYSGSQQRPSVFTVTTSEDPILGECSFNGVLRTGRSNANLHGSSQEEQNLLPRSQNHKSVLNGGELPPLPKNGSQISQEVDVWRIKVTYGNDKIQFRMPKNWEYKDLLQEIARRFDIDDINRYDLKYLDDDSEWVLLTCDDDLEECIDVCQSSQCHTIKLSLQNSPHLSDESLRSRSLS